MQAAHHTDTEINSGGRSHGETLPKTAEFDMFETKILHKTILYFNFVILPAVNFKN